jgi:predicted helicase
VVCYVSNGGYIDGNTADGLRKTLTSEFHEIYVYNLRGNQRTAGEQSRKEGGKIFDAGSRATVAVLLLVKRPGPVTGCRLNYRDIGDYLDRKQKLAIVDGATLHTIPWEQLTPNVEGDWINQRNDLFETFPPIGSKDSNEPGIFRTYSGGLKTNRDAWVYNSSGEKLRHNVESMVDFYNSEVDRYTTEGNAKPVDGFINLDPKKMSWNRADKVQLKRGTKYSADKGGYRVSTYRPFNKQHVQFNRQLNDMIYKLPVLFPAADVENFGFVITSPSSHYPTFEALMIDGLPDLHTLDTGQFFPRYTYATPVQGDDLFAELAAASPDAGAQRIDNVTDEALAEYRALYGTEVSKDDIFYYVYGLLHSPEYRERFAADLKKMLPRIPKVPATERFNAFADAGRQLAALHIGYDDIEPFPLTEHQTGLGLDSDEYTRYAVAKMKYGGKAGSRDKTRIIYNAHLTLDGIPAEAHEYMLGSRSAVDWILERYQVKTDKASGIVNDPNDWSREHEQPRYIVDLIAKIVTLSLETNLIIGALPELGV